MATGMEAEPSDTEPQKRLCLENLAGTPTDDGSPSSPTAPTHRTFQLYPKYRPTAAPPSGEPGAWCRKSVGGGRCGGGCVGGGGGGGGGGGDRRVVRGKRSGGTLAYTVRRAPSRIAHLLPPSLPHADSFILHKLRRTSL